MGVSSWNAVFFVLFCFLKRSNTSFYGRSNICKSGHKGEMSCGECHGRLTQWTFLDRTGSNHHVSYISDFVRITCSPVNCFRPPLINDFCNDDLGKDMLDKLKQDNNEQKYVKNNNLLNRMSEWLLFNVNSATVRLYHGENKLMVNETMMMRSALY